MIRSIVFGAFKRKGYMVFGTQGRKGSLPKIVGSRPRTSAVAGTQGRCAQSGASAE